MNKNKSPMVNPRSDSQQDNGLILGSGNTITPHKFNAAGCIIISEFDPLSA